MASQDFRVNHRIRVPEVRLIDAEGEQVGVIQTKVARQMAQDSGLDLVEVSPQARPPVCKIMDFGKFKYEQRKKEKRGAGKKTVSQLKELRVRPRIDKQDLSYRLENGRKFLMQGHKVQVVCIFRGRQMAHPEHGYEVMAEVAKDLEDISKVESPAKMMGRRMTMLLSPTKAAKLAQDKADREKEQLRARKEQSEAAKAENKKAEASQAAAAAEAAAAEDTPAESNATEDASTEA